MLYVARKALSDFYKYNSNASPVTTERYSCVADFVAGWIDLGDGASACAKNYGVFMQAFFLIVEEWRRDPEYLEFVPPSDSEWRRGEPDALRIVHLAVDDQSEFGMLIFDQEFFAYKCVNE